MAHRPLLVSSPAEVWEYHKFFVGSVLWAFRVFNIQTFKVLNIWRWSGCHGDGPRHVSFHCKWFEPRSHVVSQWSMTVWVDVGSRMTDCDDTDWHFDNLSGSHHQSRVNCESSVDVIKSGDWPDWLTNSWCYCFMFFWWQFTYSCDLCDNSIQIFCFILLFH